MYILLVYERELLLLLLLLLQVIPVKVNYNYFTLKKASRLNLKVIYLKRLSFFVLLRCRIFMTKSRFGVVRYSEK